MGLYDGTSGVQQIFRKLLHDQTGATAIEYGMLIGLIAAIIVAGLSNFANQLTNTYLIVTSNTNAAQAKI